MVGLCYCSLPNYQQWKVFAVLESALGQYQQDLRLQECFIMKSICNEKHVFFPSVFNFGCHPILVCFYLQFSSPCVFIQ